MKKKKQNKSGLYQHKIVELSYEQAKLDNFSEGRGISAVLMSSTTDYRIEEIRKELIEELHNIISGDELTDHQRRVLIMRLTGKTQNEIAKHLGVTQSAIHKCIYGNIDYSNNRKRYGGVIKKLKRLCSESKKVQGLLQKIADIKRDNEEQDEEKELFYVNKEDDAQVIENPVKNIRTLGNFL